MSRAIKGDTEQAILLQGGTRVWVTVTGTRPNRGAVHLEFTFAGEPSLKPQPLGMGLSLESNGPDRLTVRADLGSYRVRSLAGVKVVGGPTDEWKIIVYTALDPSDEAETFWFSMIVDPGPIVPPPFYHLLRVVAGQVQYQGLTITSGFEFSIPAGGADLAAITQAVVQVGFRI